MLRSEDGTLWLGKQRMVVLHASALGALRAELIRSLGLDRARGQLIRMGYASGRSDAKTARRLLPDASVLDLLQWGPRLHTLEGIVKVTQVKLEADLDRSHYYGEFIWESSYEDEIHKQSFGVGVESVCWNQVGYACGFATALMNDTFILFKEVECRGRDDSRCRIVGRPTSEWEDQDEAARAMRDFRPEPVAEQLIQLQSQIEQLRTSLAENTSADGVVGTSPAFVQARALLHKAAASPVTVLLLGETGVGKEMFARSLHEASDRVHGPFMATSCAALPEDLIEAELFGIEQGPLTGAQSSRAGRFERAHGGTLFLDEIDELSLPAQAKLLRVLQVGEFERVGGSHVHRSDVRVVAAAGADLHEAVASGRFRADLFYRLHVFPIRVPPLRERRCDIAILAQRFIDKHSARHAKRITGFTEAALTALQACSWPGNVRELENVIERGIILAHGHGPIDRADLFPDAQRPDAIVTSGQTLESLVERLLNSETTLGELEARAMQAAVEQCGGNLSGAARLLGLSRRQLAYRMQKRDTR